MRGRTRGPPEYLTVPRESDTCDAPAGMNIVSQESHLQVDREGPFYTADRKSGAGAPLVREGEPYLVDDQ